MIKKWKNKWNDRKKRHPKVKKKKRKRNKQGRLTWQNLSIGKKYFSIFILTVLLFLAAGGLANWQIKSTENELKNVDDHSQRVNDMAELASIIQLKDVQVADFLLTHSNKYIDEFEKYQEEFSEIMTSIEPTLNTEEEKKLLKEINSNNTSMNNNFHNQIIPTVEDGQTAMANSLREVSTRLRTETVEHVDALMDRVKKEQMNSVLAGQKSISSSLIVFHITNVIAIIIGTSLLFVVSRRITKHLSHIVSMTTEVAHGNLTVDSMDYQGKDEIGQLAAAMNQMKENIRHILQKVADTSHTVSTNSEELTQSANEVKEGNVQISYTMEELATGSENQADSASDLAEKMNDFVTKINDSEESGQNIAAISDNVLSLTSNGTTLMSQSVQQMQKIDVIVKEAVDKVGGLDEKSNEISNLVSVIKDIAAQTNLLSLNAAIEAARAGEHGKGFAVVADEVRKLSDQVSSSVGEITTIVSSIQLETDDVVTSLSTGYNEVKEGTNQIKKTGENFSSINHSITDMAGKITTISTNLKEIAKNSHLMNGLVEEIASVSEESAAGVEEVSASAQQTTSSMEEVTQNANELAVLAEQLNEELQIFSL